MDLPSFDCVATTLALELLNFTAMNGKPIRIMSSHRNPSIISPHSKHFNQGMQSSLFQKFWGR